MRARRGIAQRYIDRLDLVKKGLRPLFGLAFLASSAPRKGYGQELAATLNTRMSPLFVRK
jgi:hypothetical protein